MLVERSNIMSMSHTLMFSPILPCICTHRGARYMFHSKHIHLILCSTTHMFHPWNIVLSSCILICSDNGAHNICSNPFDTCMAWVSHFHLLSIWYMLYPFSTYQCIDLCVIIWVTVLVTPWWTWTSYISTFISESSTAHCLSLYTYSIVLPSHISCIMQTGSPSDSHSGGSDVSSAHDEHASGFTITSRDSDILQNYLDEFQEANTNLRTIVIERAMAQLYELRPVSAPFDKKDAKKVCFHCVHVHWSFCI